MKKLYRVLSLLASVYLILLFSGNAFGKNEANDTIPDRDIVELSFGQSMIFMNYEKSLNIFSNEAIVVPTSSILFFAEFRPVKRIRIPVFFNIPTESKQFIINNVVVYERAAPTFGTGINLFIGKLKLDDHTNLEFEAAPLASFLIGDNYDVRFAPIIANRFRIIRNKDFVMYMGASYSIGINAWGLIYGTGYVF